MEVFTQLLIDNARIVAPFVEFVAILRDISDNPDDDRDIKDFPEEEISQASEIYGNMWVDILQETDSIFAVHAGPLDESLSYKLRRERTAYQKYPDAMKIAFQNVFPHTADAFTRYQ